MSFISKNFIGLKKELKKIKWPTKKELLKYSSVTIMLLVLFCLYFYGIDSLLTLVEMMVN